MGSYIIEGGYPLSGEVTIRGSKNGVLPILAAVLLVEGETILHNCPLISDFFMTLQLLKSLGCTVKQEGRTVCINSDGVSKFVLEDESVRQMRSSVVLLGALLGRWKRARLGYPGGCEIGLRPIDLHLWAFEKMGVVIAQEKDYIDCQVEDIHETRLNLDFPSVGATENIMLLAARGEGRTIVYNAAREPEIVELQQFLNGCGAKITGAGTDTIVIYGVPKLTACEFTILPDRIEAGTYLCAAAATKGEILLRETAPDTMRQILLRLADMGCSIEERKKEIYLKAPKILRPVSRIHTAPYPGFPTDMQPQFMSVLTLSKGTSMISETIFEGRMKHVGDLCRMGADITVEGQTAVIKGVCELKGVTVFGRDLRGGAALIIAGLAAKGETIVTNSCYVERGYEEIEKTLQSLGAKIRLEKGEP